MKQPPRQDFQRSEATDAGGEGGAADSADEDEFPSEQTRIDPGGMRRPTAPGPSGSSGRPSSGASTPAAPAAGNLAKLQALQSLSLDAQSSSRLPPTPQGGGGSARLPWFLLTVVCLGVGGNWAWNRYHPADAITKPGDPEKLVRTEIVSASGGSASVHMAAGFTAAQSPIAIGVPAGGRIKAVKVQNGDKVKRGQIIVLLDDSSAQAEMSLARAEVRDADRHLAQMNTLFKAQATTAIELGKARGSLEIARAKLRPIEQRIDQAKLRAPVDATVLEVLLREGEAAAPNAPIIKVADLSHLVAEADINEADLVKVHREQAVDVTSDAFADRVYKGVVREIAGQADKAKGTVTVRVELQVPDLSLRPGMSVRCAFQPDKDDKPHMYISRGAVGGDGSVWLVGSDKRVSRRVVTTRPGAGSTVEVISGLSAGDTVVSEWASAHEGQSLAVAK